MTLLKQPAWGHTPIAGTSPVFSTAGQKMKGRRAIEQAATTRSIITYRISNETN